MEPCLFRSQATRVQVSTDGVEDQEDRQEERALSLIGKLSHACEVVRPRRIFLCRIIQTAHTVERLDHWVWLGQEFRSDLWWWLTFLELWNGKGMFKSHVNPEQWFQITSDASGNCMGLRSGVESKVDPMQVGPSVVTCQHCSQRIVADRSSVRHVVPRSTGSM